DIDPAAARRVRAAFFAGLLALLAAFLMLTVTRLPYPVEAAAPDRILHVTAKQYAFALSDAPVPNAEAWEASGHSQVAEVPLGTTVEFRVATLDVNHGFSLYAPDGQLVAQTQA